MAGRSESRIAYDDATSSHRDAYLQRIIDHVGTGDVALILRRIVALVEAGETGVSIAARLNGPARLPRVESELMLTIAEPAPSRATVSIVRPRPRNDVEAARDARLTRQMHTVGAKPKTPPAERPPKADPKKPRPVKRPAPQRNAEAVCLCMGVAGTRVPPSTKPCPRHGDGGPAKTIRKGTQLKVADAGNGGKIQTVRCACGNVYRRPYRPGRIPGTCETCR